MSRFLHGRWWLLSGVAMLLGGTIFLLSHHSSTASAQPALALAACRAQHAPYPNIQVSHDRYQAHAETSLAINPNNPLNLAGGAKYFPTLDRLHFTDGYVASFDGGCTWLDGGPLPGYAHPQVFGSSDPTFAFGMHNDVHVAVAYDTGIGVSSSYNGGVTFADPVFIVTPHTVNVFGDKPWITVDHGDGPYHNDIYVTFTNAVCNPTTQFCAFHIGFSRSTDAGKTFSVPQNIEGFSPLCTAPTDIPNSCDGAFGAVPAVEPDGSIAVIYEYQDASGAFRSLNVASHDGGRTWRAPTLAATPSELPIHFPGENYSISSLPAFAAGARVGEVYLTWADYATGDADILFVRSLDNGRTWSVPQRVNDDRIGNGAEQFQPQIAVSPHGTISISFFDTRRDPQHKLVDVYLAQSVNDGESFLTNVRVTTQNWDPQVGAPFVKGGPYTIGDYQGLAVNDDAVYPFWNDSRLGSQQIFTAILPEPCRDETTAQRGDC